MRATSATAAARRRRGSALTVGLLALCGTVVSLTQTVVVPLLPDFPRLLDTSVDSASWLVTATLLAGAVSTPTASRLADMFGKKRIMLATLAIMVAGSFVGAFSDTLAMLVVARVLQGAGMALVPVGIAAMRDELPSDRVPLGVALMSATLAIGAGAGLPLTGVIAQYLDWQAVFWVTGVFGAVMCVAIAVVLSESPVRTRGTFDYLGAILLSTALTALLLALSKGSQWGWTSASILGLTVGGLAIITLWVPVELKVRNPVVDVRVAARPAVLLVNICAILSGFAMFANMLVTTQQLQVPEESGYGLGLDPLATGLWMAPSAVVFGLMAPVSAWITRRFRPQTTLCAGAAIMVVSYVGRVYLSAELWQIVLGSVLVSIGTSMVYAAMPTLLMRAVPITESASANGLNTLLRSVGTSTSSAAMGALASMGAARTEAAVHPSLDSLLVMFWVSAALAACTVAVTIPMFRMRDFISEQSGADDHRHDAIVHGNVLSSTGDPIPGAVVTALTMEGTQVDWDQADSAGDFSVAIPHAGRYLVIGAAEGWHPSAGLKELRAGEDVKVVLAERLALQGRVTDTDGGVVGAVVVVTRVSGEPVDSGRTAADGLYCLAMPPAGRYVLTALAPDGATRARALTTWGAPLTMNLDLSRRTDGDTDLGERRGRSPRPNGRIGEIAARAGEAELRPVAQPPHTAPSSVESKVGQ